MRSVKALLVLALLIPAAGSAGELSVYVFKSGEPVPGAAVVVDEIPAGRTGMDGAISTNIEAGEHRLEVTEPGGEPASFEFRTSERESAEIGVRLARDTQFSLARFPEDEPRSVQGELAGQVVHADSGEPVAGATVTVIETGDSVTTDTDGRYLLALPRGVYELRVSHPELASRRLGAQRVVAALRLDARVQLAEPGRQETIEEVVAVASYIPDTPVEVERRSDSVLDVISAEDIAISGDANAAAALKRVTGLTVSEGKFIFVRGLGERYSQTLLNGAELPSPDPTRRIVPLDLFPTGVLSDVKIQKTYTPDMPGDFSGGVVRLGTRGVPDDFIASIGVKGGANSETTLGDGFFYDGGDSDWTGFDDGTRDIPDTAQSLTQGGTVNLNTLSSAEREQVAESLSRNYDINRDEIPGDVGLDAMIGDRFSLEGAEAGYRVAVMYDNDWRFQEESRRSFGLGGGGVRVIDAINLQRTTNTIDFGVMGNASLEYGDADRLDSTTLLTRQTQDAVLLEQGFLAENDRDIWRSTLEWIETQLLSQQFSGRHIFSAADGLELDWHATYSEASRDKPDTREITYARDADSGDDFRLAALTSLGRRPVIRSWEFLDDTTSDLGADLSYPFSTDSGQEWEIRGGAQVVRRDRDFEIVRWRFDLPSPAPAARADDLNLPSAEDILTPDTIGPGQWELFNGNLLSDTYSAAQDVDAVYLMADTWWTDSIRTQFGARWESSDLSVTTAQLFNPATATISGLDTSDVLPAFNLTWMLDDVRQLRFGLSQTVNRPQFRELSPVPFTDPETRYVREGNPNLRQAEILNFDLRYEHYWSGTEGYSIAAFYKDFSDPIEQVIVGGGSGGSGVRTFDNVSAAENFGVELEYRQGLDRFFENEYLRRMYVAGNVSFIESSVQITAAQAAVLTSLDRELQGQSPWIFNGQLGYRDDALQLDAALSLNVFGERIVDVGQKGLPDAREQPSEVLDLALTKGFGERWSVKFKAQNILDPVFETTQGPGVQRSYEKGVTVSLSGEYRF